MVVTKNCKFVSETANEIIIKSDIKFPFLYFNFCLNYAKGDEDSISIRFKFKLPDLSGYYYLCDKDGTKVEYKFEESDSIVIYQLECPANEGMIVEVFYASDKPVEKKGDITVSLTHNRS